MELQEKSEKRRILFEYFARINSYFLRANSQAFIVKILYYYYFDSLYIKVLALAQKPTASIAAFIRQIHFLLCKSHALGYYRKFSYLLFVRYEIFTFRGKKRKFSKEIYGEKCLISIDFCCFIKKMYSI